MHRVTQEQYPLDALQRSVNSITFFKDLIQTDSAQFELLMSVTSFVTAESGEVILHKGDDASILYFLLKGQLDVLADDQQSLVINEINPGEPFGVMAMLMNFKRSASIRVASKNVLLAGVDYQYFNDLEDFSTFTLTTKISFFRMLCSRLRWTLESNKIKAPDHPMVSKIRTIPLIHALKNTIEELKALYEQANVLAELVNEWNQSDI